MAILEPIAAKNRLPNLKMVSWDDLIQLVYIPNWEKVIRQQQALLKGLTPGGLPGSLVKVELNADKMSEIGNFPPDQRVLFLDRVVGIALTMAMLRTGWQAKAEPGKVRICL